MSPPERQIMGVDESKEKSLRRRNRGMTEFRKWYEIWDVLFPTIPPPETPYCSGEFYLEHPDAQRAVSRILSELQNDLLEATRSATQLRNDATADDSLKRIEHAIQNCVGNAISKWAPLALQSNILPPADIDPPKATLETLDSSSALTPPDPPTGVGLQTTGTSRVQPARVIERPVRVGRPEWDKYKNIIKHLYIDLDNPLPDVIPKMKEAYGFVASVKQYRYQFEIWGWKKYNQGGRPTQDHSALTDSGFSETPQATEGALEELSSLENQVSTKGMDAVLAPLTELPPSELPVSWPTWDETATQYVLDSVNLSDDSYNVCEKNEYIPRSFDLSGASVEEDSWIHGRELIGYRPI
ncbi:hypothetical protein HD806DRAFT_10302 [Xylariaceae sp. AK1471]|nr:hypothetical protein HD806DRAFT_10302 [Xylariaceae sp. AK1471]